MHLAPGTAFPISVGANREESCVRPATLPTIHKSTSSVLGNLAMPTLIAGEDRGQDGKSLLAGTWLGINQAGLAVAVTNRDDCKTRIKTQSRGLLVNEILACAQDVDSAADLAMGKLYDGGYGGCNLMIADMRGRGCVVYSDSEKRVLPEKIMLPAGLHVLTNLDVDDPEDKRIEHVKKTLDLRFFKDSAMRVLSHETIIINDDEWGTISSSVARIGEGFSEFHHCLGKPTPDSYADFSDLFRQMYP